MSLTRVLSIALCAAALCAAPSHASAQTRPVTTAPPVSGDPPAPSPTPPRPSPTPPPPAPMPSPPVPPRKVVPGAGVPKGWERYEVGEPRLFAVALPAKHDVETELVRVSTRLFAPAYTYSGDTDDGTYIVYYMEKLPIDAGRMPENLKNDFYKGVWLGLVGSIQQEMEKNGLLLKLESGESKPAKVSGLDAREQDFTLGLAKGRARMVLSGNRIFVAVLMEELDADISADGLAFLNSLEVYPAPR